MFYRLLCENSASARALRTVLQGIIAVLMGFLAFIQIVERAPSFVEVMTLLVIPTIMAILSVLMAKLGEANKAKKDIETSKQETDCMGTGGVFGEVK